MDDQAFWHSVMGGSNEEEDFQGHTDTDLVKLERRDSKSDLALDWHENQPSMLP